MIKKEIAKQSQVKQSQANKEKFLATLSSTEGKVNEALRYAEINQQTYYSWLKRDNTFKLKVEAILSTFSDDSNEVAEGVPSEALEVAEGVPSEAIDKADEYERKLAKIYQNSNVLVDNLQPLIRLTANTMAIIETAYYRARKPQSTRSDIKLYFDGVKTLNTLFAQMGLKIDPKELETKPDSFEELMADINSVIRR